MNVADLTTLIRTGLDAAGKTTVPVVAPGTTVTVLPAVALGPADNALENGNRTLRYGFDVTVLVHRSNQVAQYTQLVELESIVVASLIPSTVRFEGPILFAATGGDGTGEPPALSRVIPVTFASDVDLCP